MIIFFLATFCDDELAMLVPNEESEYDEPPPLIPVEMGPSCAGPFVLVPNEMPLLKQPPLLVPRENWKETHSLGLASSEFNSRASQDRFQSAPVLLDSSEQIKSEVHSETGDGLHDVDQVNIIAKFSRRFRAGSLIFRVGSIGRLAF